MDETLKKSHETFVTGHHGTNTFEIDTIVLLGPLLLFVSNLTFPIVCSLVGKKMKLWHSFLYTFTILVVGVILVTTVLSDLTFELCVFVCVLLLCFVIICETNPNKVSKDKMNSHTLSLIGLKTLNFNVFTNYRSLINISSCICILAVDFKIFPRRYCKTEDFGTSLMDVGVGSYVMCNAVVSPYANPSKLQILLQNKTQMIRKAIKSSSYLLIAGFLRLALVKLSNYQEHESEYGRHWNFFFTLASVKIFSSILMCITNYSALLCLASMLVYQLCLTFTPLQNFVFRGYDSLGQRSDLFEANREGIFSVFGYLMIYFAGAHVGRLITITRNSFKQWGIVILKLFLYQSLLTFVILLLPTISRRLANLGYVLWMISMNTRVIITVLGTQLFYIYLLKRYAFIRPTEYYVKFNLMEKLNRYGMYYFLLCNVLTGVVNFSINTIEAEPLVSVITLIAYQLIACVIVTSISSRNSRHTPKNSRRTSNVS